MRRDFKNDIENIHMGPIGLEIIKSRLSMN